MNKHLSFFFILLFSAQIISAQIEGRDMKFPRGKGRISEHGKILSGKTPDSTANATERKKLKVYPLSDYQYYFPYKAKDTLSIDTLISIKHHIKNNFTQKDIFDFMPFQNIGQPLNFLSAKSFYEDYYYTLILNGKAPVFRSADNIEIYHAPTPYSRLYYLSGNKKGQMLDSKIGIRVKPNWYIGVGYMGLSSLGYYQNGITSQENWFINTEYFHPGKIYLFRFFIVKNHLENEEYGGIVDENLFENPGENYLDRGKIPVRIQAKSIWHSREIKITQEFRPLKNKHLLASYDFNYTKAYYDFNGTETYIFGNTIPYSRPTDSTGLRNYRHEITAGFDKDSLSIQTGLAYHRLFVQYDTTVVIQSRVIPKSHHENYLYWIVNFRKKHKNFNEKLRFAYDLKYNQLIVTNTFNYQINKHEFQSELTYKKGLASYKYRFWQSRFADYNWYNNFGHTEKFNFTLSYRSPYGKITADTWSFKNPVYFAQDSLPAQFHGNVRIFSLRYEHDFKWKKFGMAPAVKWQKINQNPAMDLPAWNLRVLIYYTDWWFKHNMRMQSGLQVRYFSSFYMSGFNPLYNDFFQQRRRKYGNFYLMDLFFDFKVKKFRAYASFSHFNALWERTHPSYYSAPYYPYADYFLRLGITWEFVN